VRNLFDHVWQDGGLIVAVSPREPFARYFSATAHGQRGEAEEHGVKHGSDGDRPSAAF